MIGSIIFSEIYLAAQCLGKNNRKLIIPVSVPVIILQLLYCPCPEESFYWYTGAVNYTFVYSMSLVLIALFLKLSETMKTGRGMVLEGGLRSAIVKHLRWRLAESSPAFARIV